MGVDTESAISKEWGLRVTSDAEALWAAVPEGVELCISLSKGLVLERRTDSCREEFEFEG